MQIKWTNILKHICYNVCIMFDGWKFNFPKLAKTDKYHDQPYSFEYNYITLVLRVKAIMFIKYLG